MVKAVTEINKAIVEGASEAVLEALKSPVVAIRSITDACADTYQEKLKVARAGKEEKCKCTLSH